MLGRRRSYQLAHEFILRAFENNAKAEAVRKSQETLSRNPKFVHPFYWGAFILYGECR